MKPFYIFCFTIITLNLFSQGVDKNKPQKEKSFIKTEEEKAKDKAKIASIDLYKVITIDRDTTFIDTTLSIRKEHIFNFLRKDEFGLLPFANEGQTYNTLHFTSNKIAVNPQFGFSAKHFNYLESAQIKYYSVPTPLTELYFKTVMEQGQSLDAFLTFNTHERLNFALAYKGLRSIGKYVNQLSSSGNFRFSTNYSTKNSRYLLKAHIAVQDMFNGENGGIINNADFEGKDPAFRDRARLQVYTKNASTFLKGNRYFINQFFRINKTNAQNNIFINHQLTLENKFFEYKQGTLTTTITVPGAANQLLNRYGASYVSSNIDDKTNFNEVNNNISAVYENKSLGTIKFFIDDSKYNYFYNSTLVTTNNVIPSSLNSRFTSVGGQYLFQKQNWNFNFKILNAITNQSTSNIDLRGDYMLNDDYSFSFEYQKSNSAPNFNYNLNQSSFVEYNYVNNFKNEKSNSFFVAANTKWINLNLEYASQTDKLYFEQKTSLVPDAFIVAPKQYDGVINFFLAKASREFVFGRFAIDNVLLYQNVNQSAKILNVPQFVCRNSIYYSDKAFKKAMDFQTGITLNFFTKYYANEYNAVLGEFFIQEQKKIGNFPVLDFFINAKVRQTRIYLKAEHFNSSFSKNFYASPTNPYRDFIVRFGLVWNFFQ